MLLIPHISLIFLPLLHKLPQQQTLFLFIKFVYNSLLFFLAFMGLEEKISKLKTRINFDKTDITVEGYGTFIPAQKNLLKEAYATKKSADTLLKTNRKEGNAMYLKSVFLYIRGYREEEIALQRIRVEGWQGLCKFINGVVSQLVETECGFRNIFEFILYNIKTHYLHIEAILCVKNKVNADHVLNQYIGLKAIFDRSSIENFYVTELDKLEDLVSNRLVLNLE